MERASTPHLYASPMAGGIWYTDLPPMPDAVEESNDIALIITPNPASAFISVFTQEALHNAELTVYNLQGKDCYNGQMRGTFHEIPTYGFPAGIYFVKVATSDAITVRKVAIQH